MSDAEVLAIGRQIAQCIRDQGIVEMPDPIVDENHHIQLPEGAEEQIEGRYPEATLQQAQQACQSLFDQLPESAVRDGNMAAAATRRPVAWTPGHGRAAGVRAVRAGSRGSPTGPTRGPTAGSRSPTPRSRVRPSRRG
jgi:hypothetical protein